MTHDFSSAMRRATELVRAGKPGAATAVIRTAIAGTGAPQPTPQSEPQPARGPATVAATPQSRRKIIGRGLRETLAGLARRMPKAPDRPPAPIPELPRGASFDAARFTCAAGSREYRLYMPASAQRGPAGLVVMLHGCTQSPLDFAAGTDMNRLAEEHGLIVLYPDQSRQANAHGCWNWFNPADQGRGAGEPAILAAMTEDVARRLDVPRDRIFVAGLSAGAAMAVILGHSHGDIFRALGAHSGLPYRAATDVASAFAAMAGKSKGDAPVASQTPTIVFHGSADATVNPINGRRIADSRLPGCVELVEQGQAGGRSYSRATIAAPDGRPQAEYWQIEGLGHAWSGGSTAGSYTDATGPKASAEMVRFFLEIAADRERRDG